MNIWEQNHHVEATRPIVATSTSIQGQDSSIPSRSSDRPSSLADIALLIMIGIAFLSAIGLTIGKISWVYRRKSREQLFRIESANTMLCQRCRYFCANPYLKCTVHPVTVMTEASLECSDYSPQVR